MILSLPLLVALYLLVYLLEIQGEFLYYLLSHVLLCDAMHQKYAALLWKKLPVEDEAEARAISNLLTLVVCGTDEEVIDDLRILIDCVFCRGFQGLSFAGRSLKFLGLLIIDRSL